MHAYIHTYIETFITRTHSGRAQKLVSEARIGYRGYVENITGYDPKRR